MARHDTSRTSQDDTRSEARRPKPYPKPRARPHKTAKPDEGASDITRTTSISKLKSQLRQSTRLLNKDRLDAALRVETERRIEVLGNQIGELEKARPAPPPNDATTTRALKGTTTATPQQQQSDRISAAPSAAQHDKSTTAPPTSLTTSIAKSKTQKVDSKLKDRYKMLRHFEYQKASRRLKSAKKRVEEVGEEQAELRKVDESASGGASSAKSIEKKLKKLQKALHQAEEAVLQARVDAWYVETFPHSKRYVSLFPAGEYVEADSTHLQGYSDPSTMTTEDQAMASLPPAKAPGSTRQYWRTFVRGQIDRGELQGEPVKKKATKKQQQQQQQKGAVASMDPQSRQANAQNDVDMAHPDEEEEDTASDVQEKVDAVDPDGEDQDDDDEEDDFFE